MRFVAQRWFVAFLATWPATVACEASFLSGGAQPEQPQWVHRPSGSMAVVYRVPLIAPIRQFGEPYQRGGVEVDRQGMRVFVGTSDNGLYALDAKSGRTLWRFETTGAVQSVPLYDPREDAVYFGSMTALFTRFQPAMGNWCIDSTRIQRLPNVLCCQRVRCTS